jgi:hypothetical protein
MRKLQRVGIQSAYDTNVLVCYRISASIASLNGSLHAVYEMVALQSFDTLGMVSWYDELKGILVVSWRQCGFMLNEYPLMPMELVG